MQERKRGRTQAEPRNPEMIAKETIVMRITVIDVADQRMSNAIEVPPDLMPAPARWPDVDERIARGRVAADRKRQLDPRARSVRSFSEQGLT